MNGKDMSETSVLKEKNIIIYIPHFLRTDAGREEEKEKKMKVPKNSKATTAN